MRSGGCLQFTVTRLLACVALLAAALALLRHVTDGAFRNSQTLLLASLLLVSCCVGGAAGAITGRVWVAVLVSALAAFGLLTALLFFLRPWF